MKIKFLFLFLALLIHLTFFAQINFSEFEYGVRAGANVADLRTDRSGMNVRATYNLGFMAEAKINERWSLSPEIIYSRQGEVDRGVVDGVRFDNTLILDYISLPILGKYYLVDGLAIETGPQIAYLIRADQSLNSTVNSELFNVSSNYTNFDLLYNLGLSYKTDWGFYLGLRYSHGLINVMKVPSTTTNSQRHAIYQFNFGFFL